MNKLLLTDVDNCVLAFDDAWAEYMIAHHGIELPSTEYLRDFKTLRDAVQGMTLERETQLVWQFVEDGGFFDLKPMDGAPEAFQSLHSDGWEFVAITACPDGEGFSERRKANLEHALGVPFRDVHITGLHQGKKEALSLYPPAVWVEDNFHNAIVGHRLGHRSYLRYHGYKADDREAEVPFSKVSSWEEILQDIL